MVAVVLLELNREIANLVQIELFFTSKSMTLGPPVNPDLAVGYGFWLKFDPFA